MKLKKIKTKLSKNLWVAIRQAVADIEAVLNSTDYSVYMGDWHEFSKEERICSVCLAGATIARRTNTRRTKNVSASDFENRRMLCALDCIRGGNLETALCRLGLTMEGSYRKKWRIPHYGGHAYNLDPLTVFPRWKKKLLEIADYIENNQRKIVPTDEIECRSDEG